MTDNPNLPRAAALLGAAGLLPSLAAAGLVWFGPRDLAAIAFSTGVIYGALILSFLGGAWWGLACARAEPARLPALLVLSVMPSLIGWLALVALSPQSTGIIAACFLGALAVERRLAREALVPAWWLRLRTPLSLAMGGLHLLIALGAYGRGY